ncbi:UNVERIFIED_CONTAM: hypothetical protein K2H54_056537, partial [Gekko kuhli]
KRHNLRSRITALSLTTFACKPGEAAVDPQQSPDLSAGQQESTPTPGQEGKGEMLLGAACFPAPTFTIGLGTEKEGGDCQPELRKLQPHSALSRGYRPNRIFSKPTPHSAFRHPSVRTQHSPTSPKPRGRQDSSTRGSRDTQSRNGKLAQPIPSWSIDSANQSRPAPMEQKPINGRRRRRSDAHGLAL